MSFYIFKVPVMTKYGTLGGRVYDTNEFEAGFFEQLEADGLAAQYISDKDVIIKDKELTQKIEELTLFMEQTGGSGGGGTTIDDNSITSTDKTWSANKINLSLSSKSDANHAHSLDALTDVNTSTTPPINGSVLKYNGSQWVPGTDNSGSGGGGSSRIYEIELSRWGITQGLPTKPYVNDNYITANNNITGINAALQWANENNYNYVIFPRGYYSICYPNPIETQSNMTIDFNFSTFKVIYDSDNKSPFDTRLGTDYYNFIGNSIECTTPYTNIVNLELIGDRADRSWLNENEKIQEHTNGIKFGAGSDYSSVRNCNLSNYMGDALCLAYSPYNHIDVTQMEFGELSKVDGSVISSSDPKRIRNINYLNMPEGMTGFSMIGLGYAPQTTIPSSSYDVYFYKTDNSFISYKLNVRTRDLVQLPKGAAKVKLSWVGDGTIDQGLYPDNPPYWALLVQNGLANNIIVEYNEIHRCHRGGVFLGTNNVTIRKNYFHDTGMEGTTDIDGLPTFPDGTRYAINTEDNIGHNCKIQDNVFDNIRLAVALRGEFNEVTGNEFKNCLSALQIYMQKNILVDKNYFHYSGIGNYEYDNLDRNWSFTNNVFSNSSIGITGSGTSTSFIGNYLVNSSAFNSSVSFLNFKSNTFDNSFFSWLPTLTVIDGCTFINGGSIRISSQSKVDQIIRCSFINSYIRVQNTGQVIVRDSYFKDSAYNYSSGICIFTLVNCEMENTTQSVVYSEGALDIGPVNHTLELFGCTISLGHKAILSSMAWGKLIIDKSTITFNLTANKGNVLVDLFGNITDTIKITNSIISNATAFNASHTINEAQNVILVDNTFTKFSLTGAIVPVKGYDANFNYLRMPTLGTSAPAITPEYVGQTFIDTTNKKIYQAVGTTSNTDWVLLN